MKDREKAIEQEFIKEHYVNLMEGLHVDRNTKKQLLENAGMKKRRFNMHQRMGYAVAVLLAMVLFVIPSPVSTKAREYCRLAVYHIGNLYSNGSNDNLTDYVTQPVLAEKDGDLAVQLNEVLVDGHHMTFNFTVACDDPIFRFREEPTGGTYLGYYSLRLKKISINGKKKKFKDDDISGYMDSTNPSIDHYTYQIEDELCMIEFADELNDVNKTLKIEMDIDAVSDDHPMEDIRHYRYSFEVNNRALQLETKEIPLNQEVKVDDVTLKLDKMTINQHNQRVYFYIDGVNNFDYRTTSGPEDTRYEFTLSGQDELGNRVYGFEAEIIDGYGFFELLSDGENADLRNDVEFYDLQIHYHWNDPRGDVTYDGPGIGDAESIVYEGKEDDLGEMFRVDCK